MCLETGNLGVLVATLIVMLVVRFFFVRAAAADFPVEGENNTSDVGRGGAANHLSSPCGSVGAGSSSGTTHARHAWWRFGTRKSDARAPPPPAAAPAPAVGGKRKKPSLGTSKPPAVGAPAAAASPALTFGERRPEKMAEDELLWWDELNDVTEDLLNLMPTAEHPHVLNLVHYHLQQFTGRQG